MLGRELASPLNDSWRETLDRIAKAEGWATSGDVAAVGKRVSELSRAYNDEGTAISATHLLARLLFSFPRDVPKGAGAVRELVATGALSIPRDRPLRILDVGAGLGATTWGIVRALAAKGDKGTAEATWVDVDAAALKLGEAIARERARDAERSDVVLNVVGSQAIGIERARYMSAGPFDLVVLGQVLSEVDRGLDPQRRAARHSDVIANLLEEKVTPDGSLVIIEPALRERTRHLHAVRDRFLEAPKTARVFAPCPHQLGCPMLRTEGDWCHEDLTIDLPEWLVPIARAAGLRYEGLTFSYLVLRRDRATLVDAIAADRKKFLRVISNPILSKGKREVFVCTERTTHAGPRGERIRTMRLDRDASEQNAAFGDFNRGDLFSVKPELEVRESGVARLDKSALVSIVSAHPPANSVVDNGRGRG